MFFVNLAYISCALDKHSDTNTTQILQDSRIYSCLTMCFIAILKGEGGIMKKKAKER